MPITPIGDSVSAAYVAEIFNTKLEFAQDRLDKSDELTLNSLFANVNPPQMRPVDLAAALDIPPAPEIDGFSPAELTNLYQSTAGEISNKLEKGLSDFFTSYFPLGAELAAAQAWISKALTVGGTGLNPVVEEQIWERDGARILKDAKRAEDEVFTLWASRGYTLPPGALVGEINAIGQDARDKIAQASRDVAIKQAELELSNVKFAVEKAVSLRTEAVRAAGDYIRVLALGPQLGAQLATSVIDGKTKLAQALSAFYQAKISALELPVRVAIADARGKIDVGVANLSAETDLIKTRVATITAAAHSVGTQAAAALNAMSVSTQFSGSEQL